MPLLTPCEASDRVIAMGAAFGQDVLLPEEIDVSQCEEYFGIRCVCNVLVKEPNKAHVDRVDPRLDGLGHIRRDVGIPYIAMTTPSLAAIGAIAFPKYRKEGAVVGGAIGFLVGLIS